MGKVRKYTEREEIFLLLEIGAIMIEFGMKRKTLPSSRGYMAFLAESMHAFSGDEKRSGTGAWNALYRRFRDMDERQRWWAFRMAQCMDQALPDGIDSLPYANHATVVQQVRYLRQHFPNSVKKLKVFNFSPFVTEISKIGQPAPASGSSPKVLQKTTEMPKQDIEQSDGVRLKEYIETIVTSLCGLEQMLQNKIAEGEQLKYQNNMLREELRSLADVRHAVESYQGGLAKKVQAAGKQIMENDPYKKER
jgi:regulator of replication initiation timing